MTAAKRNLADWLGEAAITVLGVILAFIPLALWFAWNEATFFLVLGVGGVAFTAIFLLGHPSRPNPPRRGVEHPVLSDRFIAELQRLYPLTYHHRQPGDSGFRAEMERLLRLNKYPTADTDNGCQRTGRRRWSELDLPLIEARRTTTREANVTGSGRETKADRYILGWIVEATVTVLGIILAMVPLALWFAWSKEVYYVVLGVCGGSFAAIYLLGRFGPAQTPAPAAKRRVLSHQFISEMQRLLGRAGY